VREQPGDLGIGEGLDKPEQDRHDPHDPGRFAHRGGNRADGEQHQRGHATGDPECTAPIDLAVQAAH